MPNNISLFFINMLYVVVNVLVSSNINNIFVNIYVRKQPKSI